MLKNEKAKFEITAQIFTGGFLGESVSYEEIEQKLVFVLSRLPITKLIMGWARDKTVYEKTAAFLEKRNIEFYLWFPVFSETSSLRSLKSLVDFSGNEIDSCGSGEENFAFCCPNDTQNIENIIGIFQSEFSSIPFNGVFLDKIRYPSFANNYYGVFSCFCPKCLNLYEEKKFEMEQFKNAVVGGSLGIMEYRGKGKYIFNDPDIAEFFLMKQDIISRSLRQICSYFREAHYKIGLDVFAPFLSPFVGQDLSFLSGLCDFMKPMMYRATEAPAGLPFETNALMREVKSTGSSGNEDTQEKNFYKLLGLNHDKKLFDLDFAIKELAALVSASDCPVYAGVEINMKKDIAQVHPDYIEETLAAYARAGIDGFALSWDLLDAPEENIVKAGEMIEKLSASSLV